MTDSEKVKKIKGVVKLAEEWCNDAQLCSEMPESLIWLGALKDIRRIANASSD